MKKRKILKKQWKDRRAKKIQMHMQKQKVHKAVANPIEKNIEYQHSLIDGFIKKKFMKKIKCGAKAKVDVPQNFTFYDDIDKSLEFLENIVYLISKPSLKELFINHCNIERISLSASLILDLILMDANKYIKGIKRRKGLNICGEVKKNTDVGILIHANGVLPHLGFKVEKDPNVLTLDMLYGDAQGGNTLDPASDILKYFGECLKMQGYTLTRGGKRGFGKFLGEVLDNCKLHSGRDGKWYALGFYHNKGNKGICHIAIMTIGDTIYESLTKRGNVTVETRDALTRMTNKHKGFFNKEWNEEMLWTWLSLQHGISRLRDSAIVKSANRGMGTIDMMEAFQDIGRTVDDYKPIFSIVSGNVAIEFDFEKYPVEHVFINGEKRRIVTFNKQNSLEVKPDSKNVRYIDNHFPGTIYTMEFCIDPDYLENSNQTYIRRAR